MPRKLAFLTAVAAVSLVTPVAAQTHWVVDAAGTGQFTDLQPAIDTAQPDDVLLVLPGNYGPAVLGKRLSILGDPQAPRPVIASLRIDGAPSFTLTHLESRQLYASNVPERSLIDDCHLRFGCVNNVAPGQADLVRIEQVSDLVLSRSVIFGEWSPLDVPCGTMRVLGGSVQIVGCTLEGDSFTAPFASAGTSGMDALRLQDGAAAWIAGSVLRGGSGAHSYGGSGGGPPYAGRALVVASGARADVRGTSTHLLLGGSQLGANPSDNREAVACLAGAGPVVVSGVNVVGKIGDCVATASGDAPYLITGGADGPGLVREIAVTGAAGSPAVLAAAFGSAMLDVPWLETTPLFLAPGTEFALVPLTLGGPSAPAIVPFTQPASAALAGITVHVQAFEVTAQGAIVGTNAGAIALTF